MQSNGQRGGDEYAGRMARRRSEETAGNDYGRHVMQAPQWDSEGSARPSGYGERAADGEVTTRRRYSRVDDGRAEDGTGEYRRRRDEGTYESTYRRRVDEGAYDDDYRRNANEGINGGTYRRRADNDAYESNYRRRADDDAYDSNYRRNADDGISGGSYRRRASGAPGEGGYRQRGEERAYQGEDAAPARRYRSGAAPEFANDEDARRRAPSPVYGGWEHDNLPPADARPGVGRVPIIAMAAVALLLIVFVPMMINRGRNIAQMQTAGQGQQVGMQVTAQPGIEPTAEATTAPTAEPTPEPTPSSLIVSQYTGRTLDKDKPAVALTFDDGPSGQTPRILDALEQNGGLATFFLVGDRVVKYSETVQREYDMGCLVGTHLYSHIKLTKLSASEVKNELDQCNAAHESVLGVGPVVARPPYGSANATVKETLNMPLINWSLNSNDWETRDADRIYNDVMNNIQDGDIVLFHDLKDFSASAIERIAPALAEQGYQMVTVQELFELKGRTLEPATLYSKRVTVVDSSAG